LLGKSSALSRLVLGRSRHFAFARQVRDKLRNLFLGHLARVPFLVEENEAPDPIRLRLLGADAVMPQPNRLAHLVEEFAIARCAERR
jgi:hypothetical protein